MKIIAPGKLILSGEHAVVHGHPVLAMAVNRYTTVMMQQQDSAYISLHLNDLAYECDITLQTLLAIKKRIRSDYKRYLSGQLSIREVLKAPMELTQFTMSLLLSPTSILSDGLKINLHSTVPIGCGMGSSAATIIGLLYALMQHWGLTLNEAQVLKLGLEAENSQHGQSSGIDLYMALQGGAFFKKDNQFLPCTLPNFPLYVVNTGTPQSTTGECVQATRHFFQNSQLGDEFAAITHATYDALQQHASPQKDFLEAVRANHRLLVKIGAVPLKVQQFIQAIETIGGAAKICGAGSITGDTAGAVMVVADDEKALQAITSRYQYTLSSIQGEARGVHVV